MSQSGLAIALGRSLLPLQLGLQDHRTFKLLLQRMGWDVDLLAEHLPIIQNVLAVVDPLQEAIDITAEIADEDVPAGNRVESLLDAAHSVHQAIDALSSVAATDVSTLPVPLNTPSFWTDLALDLPEFLLVEYLRVHRPVLHGLLYLLGVIEDAEPRTDTDRRQELVWSMLTSLLPDPIEQVHDVYGWDAEFDHERLLRALLSILRGAGTTARLRQVRQRLRDEFYATDHAAIESLRELEVLIADESRADGSGYIQVGGTIVAIPEGTTDREAALTGLLIANLTWGSFSSSIALGEHWELVLEGNLEASAALAAAIRPGDISSVGSIPSGNLGISVIGRPGEPWRLLGSASGPRIELSGLRLALELDAGSDPELRLESETIASDDGTEGALIVIEPGDGDSFVRDIVGDASIQITIDARLAWSTRSGLTLGGEVGLEVDIPVDRDLGPVHVSTVHLGAQSADPGLAIYAGVTADAQIGPVTVSVDNLGLRFLLQPQDDGTARGTFGNLSVALDFRAPDGVGLQIDATVASGGGYLELDPDDGSYGGSFVLASEMFSVTVIGLLTTSQPDGSDGWSLALIVSWESTTAVQLGWGFTLNGLGGLLCIGRTMDVDALRDGLGDGALESIMFPADPVADAPLILDRIDTYFPIAGGQVVVGPFLRIGWGTPTLITADLGVLIALPDPVTIAVIGRIHAALPTEDAAVIELNLDVLGVIELAEPSVSIDATLYDSQVAGLTLAGDMALRADFGDDPEFLVAVGGFHPAFPTPSGFPSLALLAVGLNIGSAVDASLQAYIALTPNTLQFGANASISASAMGFTVEGAAGFNVLIIFSPFGFEADISASVTVIAGNITLAAIWLGASLSGPQPWHVSGTATFTILGVDVDFRVEATISGSKITTDAEPADVLELMLAALDEPNAWGEVTDDLDGAVTLAVHDSTGFSVHPHARLEVRQRVAPLGVELEVYGNKEISGERLLELTDAVIEGEAISGGLQDVEDWFAPGEFFKLTDDQRLSTPSFEKMPNGVRFGDDEVQFGDSVEATLDYEQSIIDPELADHLGLESDIIEDGVTHTMTMTDLQAVLHRSPSQMAASNGRRRFTAAVEWGFALEPSSWVVVSTDDAANIGTYTDTAGTTAFEAMLQRRNLTTNDNNATSLVRMTTDETEGALA